MLLPLLPFSLAPSDWIGLGSEPPPLLSKLLKSLRRESLWQLKKTIPLQFSSHHSQGMVKIGEEFWISSVEVLPTFPGDRSHGKGHLFQVSPSGALLNSLSLGEDPCYHPSGLDFDGQWIWIAVAEYRPNSRSVIYQVDPQHKKVQEVARWKDHLGAVACNPDTQTLHGVSWGSRRFYRWTLDPDGQLKELPNSGVLNSSHYIDYQDNCYLGGGEMLYSGVATYKNSPENSFSLGGIELIHLDSQQPTFQVPIPLWSPKTGRPMTQNACYFEAYSPTQIRAYFLPDDGQATIFVYEVQP